MILAANIRPICIACNNSKVIIKKIVEMTNAFLDIYLNG